MLKSRIFRHNFTHDTFDTSPVFSCAAGSDNSILSNPIINSNKVPHKETRTSIINLDLFGFTPDSLAVKNLETENGIFNIKAVTMKTKNISLVVARILESRK